MRILANIVIWLLKLIVKIPLLPVVAALTLVQWVGFVAVSISAWIFRILGSAFIATGILSFTFSLDPLSEMWRMVGAGAAVFLAPEILGWFVVRIAFLNIWARELLTL